MVAHCDTDEACAELLEAFYQEEPEVYVLTDGLRQVLVLTSPGYFEIKSRPVHYTVLEVLEGPLGEAVHRQLQHSPGPVYRVDLPPEEVEAVAKGEVGTYGLLVKEGGLLRFKRPITDALFTAVAEEAGEYNTGERRLLLAYRRLDPALKNAAIAAVEAMALRDA